MMMNRSPREVASLAAGLLCFVFGLATPLSTKAATSPLQAQTWDIEMTIPAGGYRASKPIEVLGEFTGKIERGAFLDGVVFAGNDRRQHWEIDGAVLRKVQINGKLGSSLRAVDTVLEECEFNKDGGWFVKWWSTRWKFENCIFTKRFMRNELSPGDYSAHATRCTFYGVNLPTISMKEDPAGYLQKENLSFVRCRFVQCEVPETFLAATVDCVFENCRFQGKRHNWPKETSPIKVNAYYAGLTGAPKSFLNGPLTVQFSEAPKGVEAGSTLAHTQSGGRITLANLRDPGQYTVIGTVSKKASEIPVSDDPTSALPPKPATTQLPGSNNVPPGAPSTPAPGSTATAGDGVYSLAEVLRPLPAGIELLTGGKLNVAGIEAANQWLANNLPGRPAAMRTVLEYAQAYKEEGYAFKVTGRPQQVSIRGVTIPAQVVALFRAEPAAALAKVSKGRDIGIRGTVQKAVLEGRGSTVVLMVTLAESQLQ